MSILSSVITKAAIKGLGIATEAAGSVVGAAGKVAKGIAGGVKNVSDAAYNAEGEQQGSNSVINNVGMAGTAGTQKVKTGGGTLPATKKAAKPAYNEKMPTEKLLVVAVNYLASIDATLRTQIENERVAYQKQAQAEKETAVENKDSVFNKLGSKFGSFAEKKPSGDMAKKLLIGGGLIAGLGALGISKLDTKELDILKVNVELFKKDYGWLVDMASFIGVGGFLGFLRGGVKGGLIGIIAEYVIDKLWNSSLNPMQPKDENGNPIGPERSAGKGALLAGAGAYGLAKSIKNITPKVANAKQLGNVVKSGSIAEIQKATRRGTTWFATKRGRKFLIILGRKLGKGMMKKIGIVLARIVGSVLLTGTGVGAIVGIAGIIFNSAVLLYGIYDIASAIWDAWNESQVSDATPTNAAAASAVSGSSPTGTTVTAPTGNESSAEPSNVPDTAYDIVLGYGKYGKPEDYYNGKKLTQLTVAEVIEFGRNVLQPRSKAAGVGVSSSGELLGDSGVGAYQTNRTTIQGAIDAGIINTNELYDKDAQDRVAKWLYNQRNQQGSLNTTWAYFGGTGQGSSSMTFEQAQPYIMAGEGTSGQRLNNMAEAPDGGSFSATSAFDIAKKIFGKAGAALIGAQNYEARDVNDNTKNVSKKINEISKQIETATIAGNKQEVAKAGAVAATAAQKSIMQASNDGSLSALDPNYPDGSDIIMKYLAHWKFAA